MSHACEHQTLVDQHFAAGLSVARERQLRGHLETCAACCDRYERHQMLHQFLPGAADAQTRLARGLGLRSAAGAPRWPWAVSTLTVAAVALLLVVHLPGGGDDRFTARGPGADVPFLSVQRVAGTERREVAGPIAASDELAFSYRNPSAKRWLMLFGVDELRRVYWYYPSWTDPAQDPSSVPATPGDGLHPLPDAISHSLGGRMLRIHLLLTDEPLTVRAVEERLAAGWRWPATGPQWPPGADVHAVDLAVAR